MVLRFLGRNNIVLWVCDSRLPNSHWGSFWQGHCSLGWQNYGSRDITPSCVNAVHDEINNVVIAYERVEELGPTPKSKEIESLANRLSGYERILKECNRLLSLKRAFFENNFLLLCFFVDEKPNDLKQQKSRCENLDLGEAKKMQKHGWPRKKIYETNAGGR